MTEQAKRKLDLHALGAPAGDERQRGDGPVLWFDSRSSQGAAASDGPISRLRGTPYAGLVLYPEDLERADELLSPRMRRIVHVESEAVLASLFARPARAGEAAPIVIGPDLGVLAKARGHGLSTGYRAYVDDAASLELAIKAGMHHDYLIIRFRDPTNIPLELVIATLQPTRTVLIKEIDDPTDVDDAIVSLGVMEVGADGVMYSPVEHRQLDALLERLDSVHMPELALEVATITRCVPIGMGYRSCLDLTTLFTAEEGLLVGSTSQGAILCCPEVFFLPYMELRPFRVNAGAVHSYVYNSGNRTDYMTEYRAGSPVMVTDIRGKTRRATIGRVKTEVRPLRLIEAELPGSRMINIIMQDDWHVRVFSDAGQPANITELAPGCKVLAYGATPGRHVGIAVDEHIIEQ
jgi:3-amino-4-hydroxybenzoic acid synthase